jgi:hypothetical protein
MDTCIVCRAGVRGVRREPDPSLHRGPDEAYGGVMGTCSTQRPRRSRVQYALPAVARGVDAPDRVGPRTCWMAVRNTSRTSQRSLSRRRALVQGPGEVTCLDDAMMVTSSRAAGLLTSGRRSPSRTSLDRYARLSTMRGISR